MAQKGLRWSKIEECSRVYQSVPECAKVYIQESGKRKLALTEKNFLSEILVLMGQKLLWTSK